MATKRIRNDRQLEAAHKEILQLWEAKPGTPEFARLDALAKEAHRYEENRWPMRSEAKGGESWK